MHPAEDLPVTIDQSLGADELHGHDADAADSPDDEAKVAVGHAGHRGEDQRRVDRDGVNLQHGRWIVID